ncbi:MAG: carboxylating nicotinate-nucleotide diphosphorylase [Actinomycetota bacterium]
MIDDPVHEAVHLALAEDLGEESDITTDALVPSAAHGRARLIAKEDATLAGCELFELTFQELDNEAVVEWRAKEGDRVRAGDVVATVEGKLRAILTGERTALNFIMRGSGTATLTRRFVEAAGGVQIRDTRKTTPGRRLLQKAAVRSGGGMNHRMGLYDAYLIKDNHIAVAGGIARAIEKARVANPGLWIEIECETIDQVKEALEAGADELLLDNMDTTTMTEAVALAKGRAKTEASGGVTLDTVGAIAKTGVDSISVGALTHSSPAVDFSLEVEPDAPRS